MSDKLVGTMNTNGNIKGNVATVLGKDGKSAYEVALKNGFEGTEAEWLASLHGERGERGEKGDKGDRGDAGSINFFVVTELPTEDIDESAIYLVPIDSTDETNTYEEYIYADGKWEMLGKITANVDLSDYVKKTDYAAVDKAGVIRAYGTYGLSVNSEGVCSIVTAYNNDIDGKSNMFRPITAANIDYAVKKALADSKLAGTENAWTDDEKKAAKDLLVGVAGNSSNKTGLVWMDYSSGIEVTSTGYIMLGTANTSEIDKKSGIRAITPQNLDYAVKTALASNAITLTDEEKAKIQAWLGINNTETWTFTLENGSTVTKTVVLK